MGFWTTLKREIAKGEDEAAKLGKAISKKAGKVADDVKTRYKAFEIKQNIQGYLTDLGGNVLDLASDKRKNPLNDERVQKLIEKIKKADARVRKLESSLVEKVKKAAPKKKAAAKKKVKKAAPKKKAAAEKTVKKAAPKKAARK